MWYSLPRLIAFTLSPSWTLSLMWRCGTDIYSLLLLLLLTMVV